MTEQEAMQAAQRDNARNAEKAATERENRTRELENHGVPSEAAKAQSNAESKQKRAEIEQAKREYAEELKTKREAETDSKDSNNKTEPKENKEEIKTVDKAEIVNDDGIVDETKLVEKATTDIVKSNKSLSRKEQKAIQEELERQAGREAYLKKTGKKDDKPEIGTMKEALARKEITKSQYNHFVFDRVMTAVGKALGFFVSRNPEWLFYKDQWAERNANLLSELKRLDRAKTTANETKDEKQGAQSRGEENVFTGEQAAAHADSEAVEQANLSKVQNEVVEQFDTKLNYLHQQLKELQSERTDLETTYDAEQLLRLTKAMRDAVAGIYNETAYEGEDESNAETNNKQSGGGVSGGIKGGIPIIKGDLTAEYKQALEKGLQKTQAKAKNFSTTYSKLEAEAEKAARDNWQENSANFKSLKQSMINAIDSQIKEVQRQIEYWASAKASFADNTTAETEE